MRIKIKEDKEVKKEGINTDADLLFDPLLSLIMEYASQDQGHLEDDKSEQKDDKSLKEDGDKNHQNTYKYQSKLTLLGNITISYASQIAHNLLWHIDIEETLEFAKQNPASLLVEVEIKDPHGQRVRGTPLQILAAAGDRNPRKMKPEDRDFGLVERLRSCFPKGSKEYDEQLEKWFQRDLKNQQTKKMMAPYVKAIEILCQEIMVSKEVAEADEFDFDELLTSPMAEKFRKALAPDPNHVVTSGLLFDLQIFFDFFEIWEANIGNTKVKDKNRLNLGGYGSMKSDLFAAIVFPSLQARVQRIDFEIFNKGIGKVIDKGHRPDHINFKNGVPADLLGLGDSFFFGYDGPLSPTWVYIVGKPPVLHKEVLLALSKLISSKNISRGFMSYVSEFTQRLVITYSHI